MWIYERVLQYPVRIRRNNPGLAKVIISQLGGPDGELGAATRYLSQRYGMPYPEVTGILTDVGTEELGHVEMVSAILYQLTNNMCIEDIKSSGFDVYFVDHTAGIYPQAASGVPFSASTIQSTGDIIADLNEDLAAEQKARTTYDNILRLADDPDVKDAIRFLRAREIVHYQRFAEALGVAQERASCKSNYYLTNPSFDIGCRPPCMPNGAMNGREGLVRDGTNGMNNTPNGMNNGTNRNGMNNVPNGMNNVPNGMNNVPNGMNNVPNGMNNVPNGMNNVPNGMNNVPNGMNNVPNGMNNAPNGMNNGTNRNGMNNAPNGMNNVPNGMNNVPNGMNNVPNGMNNVPNGMNNVPNGMNNGTNRNGMNNGTNGMNNVPNGMNNGTNGMNNIPNGMNKVPNNGSGTVPRSPCGPMNIRPTFHYSREMDEGGERIVMRPMVTSVERQNTKDKKNTGEMLKSGAESVQTKPASRQGVSSADTMDAKELLGKMIEASAVVPEQPQGEKRPIYQRNVRESFRKPF